MIDQILEALIDGQQHSIGYLQVELKVPLRPLRLCLQFLEKYGFVVVQYTVQPDKSLMPEKAVICSEVLRFLSQIKQLEASPQ